jgi:endonuclease G, mitochondrial
MKNLIFLLIVAGSLVACSSKDSSTNNNPIDTGHTLQYDTAYVHLRLGFPKDADSSDDYIIRRPQYCVSYNYKREEPNWVSYELNADWYGDVARYSGNFISDTSLPASMYRVKHSDYTNSGYDRGHMVRSEERTKTVEDNKTTFLLTNIIPQRPDLNQGVWLNFEYYCEDLCKKENKELFIMTGGIYHSNITIGNGVAVPDSCWKIVVVLDKGQGLRNISDTTRIIAVKMPNIQGVRSDNWEKYQCSVDAIEASTGYDFLNYVKKEIQEKIEK